MHFLNKFGFFDYHHIMMNSLKDIFVTIEGLQKIFMTLIISW